MSQIVSQILHSLVYVHALYERKKILIMRFILRDFEENAQMAIGPRYIGLSGLGRYQSPKSSFFASYARESDNGHIYSDFILLPPAS